MRLVRFSLLLVGLIATAYFAILRGLPAQTPGCPNCPVTGSGTTATYSLSCGLWRVDSGFVSKIHVKNALIATPLTVMPVLYMADGTQYELQPIQVPVAGTAQINVNDALSYAPPAIEPHLSEYGSAALLYQYQNPGHLLAFTEIINLPGSLIFTTPFAGVDEAAAGTQTLEAVWWRHTAQVDGFVALSNVTSGPIDVSLQPTGSQGTQLASTAITLQGHSTQMLDLDLLAWGLPQAENQAGGLRLQYYGKKRAVMATGGLVDEGIGYSTDIPFWSHDLGSTSAPVPITYASVGLMIGQPSPGMGFPAGLRFTPYAVLENTTPQPLTVTPALNYMPGGSPVTLPLPVQQLQPQETRRLDLPSMLAKLGLGSFNGDANLTFSITGHGGDLVIATASVDQTGNFVFPVPAEAIGQSFGKSIGHWTVANGVDSMYSLWNPTNADQDFVVTLYYGDGSGQYVMPLHLAAQASTTIDIGMLIAMRQPDANGSLIPNYIQEGSVVFSNPKGRAQWMTLAVCGAFYNPRKATCGEWWTYCYGYCDAEVTPNPFSVAVNGTVQLHSYLTYADGSLDEFTSSSGWSSSNKSVATVGASTGLVTGVLPGSVQIGAEFPAEVGFTGQFCAEGNEVPCPVMGFYAASSGTVDTLVFSITTGGVQTDSAGVVSGTTFNLRIQAKTPSGSVPDSSFNAQNLPFTVVGLNTSVGESAPSTVSFSSGTANASIKLVEASLLTASYREVFVLENDPTTTFFPYVYMSVTATLEGLVGQPTACGYIIPQNGQFVTLPYSKTLCGQQVLVAKGALTQQAPVEDVGPWCPNTPGPGNSNTCNCTSDPYWLGTGVPKAVALEGSCNSNGAGMDLGNGTASSVGVSGMGGVTWKFP